MRRKRPLDRKAGAVVRDASLIVIASEDTCAVKQYFDFFRSTRVQFRVLETADGKSAPSHILTRLDAFIDEYQIGEGDELWFVCDCDHWISSGHIHNLTSVLMQCRQKNIKTALSNPSFELWLLLHFAEFPQVDPLNQRSLIEQIRRAVGGYNKTRVDLLPLTNENVRKAVNRAKANRSTTPIPQHPATDIFRIIEDLLQRNIISID